MCGKEILIWQKICGKMGSLKDVYKRQDGTPRCPPNRPTEWYFPPAHLSGTDSSAARMLHTGCLLYTSRRIGKWCKRVENGILRIDIEVSPPAAGGQHQTAKHVIPVSYTHLDVYKRQPFCLPSARPCPSQSGAPSSCRWSWLPHPCLLYTSRCV